MVHRPCAAPGLGIDAAACPRARDRQIGRRSIILSKSPLFVEAPCNSPPIECLSSFLFPIISRTAPSGLDRGPIFIFYFPGIRRYAWLALANSPDVVWAKLNRGRSRASVLVRKRGRTASKWTNNRQLTYPAGGIC